MRLEDISFVISLAIDFPFLQFFSIFRTLFAVTSSSRTIFIVTTDLNVFANLSRLDE